MFAFAENNGNYCTRGHPPPVLIGTLSEHFGPVAPVTSLKVSGSCRYRFLLILGAVFDDFGRHFWSLGDLLGGIGASLSLSGVPGDPWELQGSIFMDFGSHFGGPWEVSFHVFFIINSMSILKSILVWILSVFLMIFR